MNMIDDTSGSSPEFQSRILPQCDRHHEIAVSVSSPHFYIFTVT